MRFRIEDHEWYRCPACRYLFTDELMRDVYKQRVRDREEYLASFEDDEERMAEARRLGNLGNCPRCANFGVRAVIRIGPRDRRALIAKAFFMEIGEWLRKLIPAF